MKSKNSQATRQLGASPPRASNIVLAAAAFVVVAMPAAVSASLVVGQVTKLPTGVWQAWGFSETVSVGAFSDAQRTYLAYHRQHVFKS